jgi:glutamyl-tRNA synthetase
MKVSHVLRGEDHLTNTPRQIMILKSLGLTVPQYGHLSLIVGDDGAPLSKRHGSFSVNELREQGYLPLAIINYLARLGHRCDVPELLSFDQFAPHFQIEKLSRSAARFDYTQLLYWQKLSVQALDVPGLWAFIGETILNQVPTDMRTLFAETVRSNIVFPKDALHWAKIFFHEEAEIDESGIAVLKQAGEQYFVEAEQAVEKFGIDLPNVYAEMKKTLKVEGKKLFMPMRIALTGVNHGPELVQVAKILGAKKMKHRLGRALQVIIK